MIDDLGNEVALPKHIKFSPTTQSFEVFTTANQHAGKYEIIYRIVYTDFEDVKQDCKTELIIEKSKTPFIPVFV